MKYTGNSGVLPKALVIALLSGFVFSAHRADARPNANKASIATLTAMDIAISTDDRWLFVAGDGGVDVIDTAVFEVAATLDAGSNDVVAVALSSDDAYLYMLRKDGKLALVSLDPLDDLGPGETPKLDAPHWFTLYDTGDYGAPSDMTVGPIPGYASDPTQQYVFVLASGTTSNSGRVFIYTQADLLDENTSNGTLVVGDTARNVLYVEDPRVTSIQNYALLVSSENDSAKPWISLFGLLSSSVVEEHGNYALTESSDGDLVAGLAGPFAGPIFGVCNESKTLLNMMKVDGDDDGLWIVNDTKPTMNIHGTPTALAYYRNENNDNDFYYVATTDPTLYAIKESEATIYEEIALGVGVPTGMEVSGFDDDYLYVTGDGGQVDVVTANPWIDQVAWTPAWNDGTSDTDVSFRTDTTGDYKVYRGGTIHGGGQEIHAGSVPAAGETNGFTISPDELYEGDNDIYIFMTDDANDETGRIGFILSKDKPPEKPDFTLDFGDHTVFVTIHTQNVDDIEKYTIYYSSDRATVETKPPGVTGIEIPEGSFTPGKSETVTINDLKNGLRYYFRVSAKDAHEMTYSDIKSIIAEKTTGYADSEGSGGCNRLAPGESSSPPDGLLLAVLWLATAAFLRRRSNKLRSSK